MDKELHYAEWKVPCQLDFSFNRPIFIYDNTFHNQPAFKTAIGLHWNMINCTTHNLKKKKIQSY